jgi:hypothetical protein
MEIFTVLGSNVADEGVVKEIKTEILLKLDKKTQLEIYVKSEPKKKKCLLN